jgi:uncharacterized protein (DUF302 family)
MKTNRLIARVFAGALLAAAALSPLPAASAESTVNSGHVTVASDKSFDQVSEAIKTLAAKNGMMIMAEVNQGKMLSMTGLSLKATLFLVGNPTVGKQLFEQNHGVGLYVPLRIFVYSDESGKTHVSYDKPSSLLAQFHNDKVAMIGRMLDEKLNGLATMAAQ